MNKRSLESKHRIIESIILKLKDAEPDFKQELPPMRAVVISNNVYDDDVISLFEFAKGITKPAAEGSVKIILEDAIDTQERLRVKQKLALNLKSKSNKE